MAIPNLLVCKSVPSSIGSSSAAVFELIGGTTLSQVGDNITTSLEIYGNNRATNRVIEFKGKKILWHRNTIREEDTGGSGTWGIVHTVSDALSFDNYARHSGLHVVNVDGVLTIIGLYLQTASNDVSAIRSTDGTTWTETGSLLDTGNGASGRDIVFRNKLYWRLSNNQVIEYDPLTNATLQISVTPSLSINYSQDFCTHNDNLFMLGSYGTTDNTFYHLYQLTGSSFTSVHTFSGKDVGGTGELGVTCLFTDNTDLYAIINGEAAGVNGDTISRIQNPGEGSQIVTDITSTVMPSRFSPGGSSAIESARWQSYVNNDTDPTSPEIYLWRLPSAAGNYEAFQFVDFSTILTELGGGPTYEIYLPNTKFGGGDRIVSTAGVKAYAEMEQLTTIAGSGAGVQVQFSYRVYGTGADKTATLYVDGGEEIPSVVATLTGAASGGSSSRSGNTIIDVTPDDGATLYTGVWDTGADGFAATDNVHLQLNLT
jgi:hypothetical protein